jgi:transcriptional regulator with XRE-family HTH domain
MFSSPGAISAKAHAAVAWPLQFCNTWDRRARPAYERCIIMQTLAGPAKAIDDYAMAGYATAEEEPRGGRMRESETFGSLLRAYRLRAGLAQNALARAAGINAGTVNRLEHDQRLPASRGQVLDLAAALVLEMAETNRLLYAAGLPAEGFGPAITGNPAICRLVDLLQDEAVPDAIRDEMLAIVDHAARLAAARIRGTGA